MRPAGFEIKFSLASGFLQLVVISDQLPVLWTIQESNLGRADLQSAALPTELIVLHDHISSTAPEIIQVMIYDLHVHKNRPYF